VACLTTAADPYITSVTVADRDADRARELAETIGEKADWCEVDVMDHTSLDSAVATSDLVLNTVGPFYLFGKPVLESAIRNRKHYADIADDWEPTVEMLELDDEARTAGITAIVGMGASPGVSNLLASAAHAQLDSVDILYTIWRGGVGVPPRPNRREDVKPAAAIDHWIHNLAEPIRVWKEGRHQTAEALETFEISYPGIGPATLWSCGHPEPITLPRTFTDITTCYNLMFARPGLIDAARQVRDRVRAGEIDVAEGSIDFLMMPARSGADAGPIPDYPGVFGYAEGTKDGVRKRSVVATRVLPRGGMGESTCVPLAIAAGMIARGEVDKPGVSAPEASIDPTIFFERLAPFAGLEGEVEPLDIRVEAL
jgi:saccharopine dehydrogenase (NAD+, L-lysine forming)